MWQSLRWCLSNITLLGPHKNTERELYHHLFLQRRLRKKEMNFPGDTKRIRIGLAVDSESYALNLCCLSILLMIDTSLPLTSSFSTEKYSCPNSYLWNLAKSQVQVPQSLGQCQGFYQGWALILVKAQNIYIYVCKGPTPYSDFCFSFRKQKNTHLLCMHVNKQRRIFQESDVLHKKPHATIFFYLLPVVWGQENGIPLPCNLK